MIGILSWKRDRQKQVLSFFSLSIRDLKVFLYLMATSDNQHGECFCASKLVAENYKRVLKEIHGNCRCEVCIGLGLDAGLESVCCVSHRLRQGIHAAPADYSYYNSTSKCWS